MRVKCLPILLLAVLAAATLPSSGVAQMMPVFGPNQYTRAAGPPQTFTETFEHCGTAECQLVVINGNADGINRISSASISLNGVEIVGRRDFNQQVATIVKPVELAELNELTIRLTSKPGGFLIVSVQCLASPVDLLAGGPGVTLLDTTLLSALPIFNIGTAAAENVQLTTITLDEGTLTLPTSLPFGLGTIPVGSSAILDTNFVDAFAPLESYILEARHGDGRPVPSQRRALPESTARSGKPRFCQRLALDGPDRAVCCRHTDGNRHRGGDGFSWFHS
jgi:hypothetical protein